MKKENLEKMTGRELITVADSFNVKVATNKERTGLKESKSKVIEKILAAMPKEEKKTEKKEHKARQPKRTFETLLADIPSIGNLQFTPNSKRTAVHVKMGKKRVFGYNGSVLVVLRKEYLGDLPYEVKNYGYVVEPTRENMLTLIRNAR